VPGDGERRPASPAQAPLNPERPPTSRIGIVASGEVTARVRVERERRRLRIARLCHEQMSLVAYYRGRPLLDVPLAEYLARRRWVA
jgi:hypothetical protein